MSCLTQTTSQTQQQATNSSIIRSNLLQRTAITPVHSPILQRCSNGVECPKCRQKRLEREGTLQRAAVNAAPTNGVPPIVHDVLNLPGQALGAEERAFMEPRFGHDFSGVRVHTDGRAAESAKSVNALAYTVGRDVVFGTGQYAPGTSEGRRLLAHELTHVVQQGGMELALQSQLRLGSLADNAEVEADHFANGIVNSFINSSIEGSPTRDKMSPVLRRAPVANGPQRVDDPPQDTTTNYKGIEVHVKRFLIPCPCRKVDVTRTDFFYNPDPNNPQLIHRYCHGRFTADISIGAENIGGILQGQQSTEPAKGIVGLDVNIAESDKSKLGSREIVQGVLTSEEGGGAGVSTQLVLQSGRFRVFVGAEYLRLLRDQAQRTTKDKLDLSLGTGIGDLTLQVNTSDLLDPNRRAVIFSVGGNLPGPEVRQEGCYDCFCPQPVPLYRCWEEKSPPEQPSKLQPADDEPEEEFRFYFEVNSSSLSLLRMRNDLRGQSLKTLHELEERLEVGAEVISIYGYASPEVGEKYNKDLSARRAKSVKEELERFLSKKKISTKLPPAEGVGELLGNVPPGKGSHLRDIPAEAKGELAPEITTQFLPGEFVGKRNIREIDDPKLADEFTGLFKQFDITSNEGKEKILAIFGLKNDNSEISRSALGAIESFLKRKGAGTPFVPPRRISRELDEVFQFLRIAIVRVKRPSINPLEKPPSGIFKLPESVVEPEGPTKRYYAPDECKKIGEDAPGFGRIAKVEPTPAERDSDCQERPGDNERSKGCKYK